VDVLDFRQWFMETTEAKLPERRMVIVKTGYLIIYSLRHRIAGRDRCTHRWRPLPQHHHHHTRPFWKHSLMLRDTSKHLSSRRTGTVE
jgi:hypothetical protein